MTKRHSAFTILEIFAVMVVIGVLATMTLPRIIRKPPTTKWDVVQDEMNNLVFYARQEAISTQQTFRLHFISNQQERDTIEVEVESDDPEKKDKKKYTPVSSYYFSPKYTLPEEISLQAVYHGKKEQLSEQSNHAYCFIIPNGLVQEVFVHLLKTEDGKESKVTLKMSPFFGTFELKEGFIKPPR